MEGKTCAAGGSSEAAEVIEEYLVHPQRNRNRSNRHRKFLPVPKRNEKMESYKIDGSI